MAIKLSDKPNVTAPGGAYSYGDIKDNSGSNDGTPVNRLCYGDFHQFFEKLMAEAGVVHNGLPDNDTNTYQLFQALLGNLSQRIDISGDLSPGSGITTVSLEAYEYYDGTIAVAFRGTFVSTIVAGATILSGLPQLMVADKHLQYCYLISTGPGGVETADKLVMLDNYDGIVEAFDQLDYNAATATIYLTLIYKKA